MTKTIVIMPILTKEGGKDEKVDEKKEYEKKKEKEDEEMRIKGQK